MNDELAGEPAANDFTESVVLGSWALADVRIIELVSSRLIIVESGDEIAPVWANISQNEVDVNIVRQTMAIFEVGGA